MNSKARWLLNISCLNIHFSPILLIIIDIFTTHQILQIDLKVKVISGINLAIAEAFRRVFANLRVRCTRAILMNEALRGVR